MLRHLILLTCLAGSNLYADPLSGSLELGTSASQSYEARNTFIHPAALGFDTALNGGDITTAMSLGTNDGRPIDYSFGLALSYLGLGAERLSSLGLSRYQVATGFPLTARLFFGARVGFYRYDAGQALTSWDVGFQFRPSSRFSFGALFNQVNRPVLSGSALPMETLLSATVKPLDWLELSFDTVTPSTDFFRTFTSQALVGVRLKEGVKVRLGYHQNYQWMAGVQIHFGTSSAYSSVQPTSPNRKWVMGVQSGTQSYATKVGPRKTVRMTVGNSLSDEKVAASFFSPSQPSLLDLLKDLETLEKDPSVESVVLRLEGFPLGLASAHEAHLALRRLRRAGKSIHVYLGNSGIKEYLIASAADRISMEPAGEIRWLGVRAERYFGKGTLDKVGVEAEFLAAGKYKSAPEMFTRKDSSEAARSAALEEIKGLEESLIKALTQTRKIDRARWKKLLELGLLSASEAKEEGLIDAVEAHSSALAALEKTRWVTPLTRPRKDTLALPRRIAVVVASGNILPDKIRFLSMGGTDQVTPRIMKKKLDKAQLDSRTAAVLLRVSSPGGEVLASQEIASQLEAFGKERDVIVSMGDVAASGGYYIAAPAKRVFASPMTLTGSIGVFLGKFSFAGLYKFIDLHKELLTQGPYPGLYSEDRSWTKSERAVMERRLNHYYDAFVNYVSVNREISKTDAGNAAQGRVWTGLQALDHKLVDEMGGYYEAIQYTALEAGLDPGEFEVWEIEQSAGLFQMLADGEPWSKVLGQPSPAAELPPALRRSLLWMSVSKDTPYLFLNPVSPPDA